MKNFSKLHNIWYQIGPFNMDLFSHRLILQKKIFLLQEAGFNLGYNFKKYIRGPYCKKLATDGYKMNVAERISGDGKIPDGIIDKLEKLGKDHEDEVLWFELLASILYCVKKENLSIEKCRDKIEDEKPYLDIEKNFKKAILRLKENSFID